MTRKNKKALLIVTNEYAHESLKPLVSIKEVEALAAVLEDPNIGNFEVTKPLINQPKTVIDIALTKFFRDASSDDLLFVYFSCHGLKNNKLKLYFATNETDPELIEDTAVSAYSVNEKMTDSDAKQKILVLDCCFSGSFAEGITAMSAEEQDPHLEEVFDGSGRIVITSAAPTQYSYIREVKELGEKRSYFTGFLIEGLKTGDADLNNRGSISVNNIHNYIRRSIIKIPKAQRPNQNPEIWTFKGSGDITIANNPHKKQPDNLASQIREAINKSDWEKSRELLEKNKVESPIALEIEAFLNQAAQKTEIREDWDGAAEIYKLLLRLNPGSADIRQKHDNSSKQKHLLDLYAEGKAFLDKGELSAARKTFEKVSEIAQSGYKDVEQAIAEIRKEQSRRAAPFETAIEAAIKNEKWRDALSNIEKLKEIYPDDNRFTVRFDYLKKQQKLHVLYSRAEELSSSYVRKELAEARKIFEEIQQIEQNYKNTKILARETKDRLSDVEKELREKIAKNRIMLSLAWLVIGAMFAAEVFLALRWFSGEAYYQNKSITFLLLTLIGSLIALGLFIFYRRESNADTPYRISKIAAAAALVLIPVLSLVGLILLPTWRMQAAQSNLEAGKKFLGEGKLEQAHAALIKSRIQNANVPDVHHYLAQVYYQKPELGSALLSEVAAINLYREASGGKTNPNYLMSRAKYYYAENNFPEAQKDLDNALYYESSGQKTTDPSLLFEHAQIRLKYGYDWAKKDKERGRTDYKKYFDEGIANLYSLDKTEQCSIECYSALARALAYRDIYYAGDFGAFKEADAAFRKYVEKGGSQALVDRSEIYLERQLYVDALKDAEAAYNLSRNERTLNLYLKCNVLLKKYQEATMVYENDREFRNDESAIFAGVAYFEKGERDRGKSFIRPACKNLKDKPEVCTDGRYLYN